MNWIKYNDERMDLDYIAGYKADGDHIVFSAIENGQLQEVHHWEFDSTEERDKILEQLDRKCSASKLAADSTVGFS